MKRPAALASHDIMQVQIVDDPGPRYGTRARDFEKYMRVRQNFLSASCSIRHHGRLKWVHTFGLWDQSVSSRRDRGHRIATFV